MRFLRRKELIVYIVILIACIIVRFITGSSAPLVVLAAAAAYGVFAVLSVFVCGRHLSFKTDAAGELRKGVPGI